MGGKKKPWNLRESGISENIVYFATKSQLHFPGHFRFVQKKKEGGDLSGKRQIAKKKTRLCYFSNKKQFRRRYGGLMQF